MLRKAFAKTLKELRTKRKISQLELSKLADLNRTYLSLLERGRRSPSLNTINKIASVFEINPSDLMNLVEKNSDEGEVGTSREDLICQALLSADMGLWSFNFQSGDIYHNEWWTERLGYNLGEESFTLESFKSLIYPDDISKVELALAQHKNGIISHYEVQYRIRAKNGHWKQIWCRGKIVSNNEAGEPLIMTGVHLDISHVDLKILEKNEFEGMRICGTKLAHEINNPLCIIRGNIELLKQDGPDENFEKRLNHMEHAVDRIVSVVSRMMETSSLKAEGSQEINVASLLDQALLSCMAKKGATRQVIVEKKYESRDYMIEGASGDLLQAFTNIIFNAFESISENEVLNLELKIWLEGELACIAFQDNGKGIDARHMPFVYDMFFTTKNPNESLGLGLSFARTCVYRLGGTIDIFSQPTKGTSIVLKLPLKS